MPHLGCYSVALPAQPFELFGQTPPEVFAMQDASGNSPLKTPAEAGAELLQLNAPRFSKFLQARPSHPQPPLPSTLAHLDESA
jgi:hypothetical protein